MEIKVISKPIEVLVGKDDKYGLKLRQLTMSEVEELRFLESNESVCELIDKILIEFINKPNLVDEDGEEVKYNTLAEFRDLTLSNELLIEAGNALGKEIKKKVNFTKK